MLHRIDELLTKGVVFAFETTLSTRSYVGRIKEAQRQGYFVTLLFFWLDRFSLAKERVAMRVSEGGHNIPVDVIERRYKRGIKNLFDLYQPICDKTIILDNSHGASNFVMTQNKGWQIEILDEILFKTIIGSNE